MNNNISISTDLDLDQDIASEFSTDQFDYFIENYIGSCSESAQKNIYERLKDKFEED